MSLGVQNNTIISTSTEYSTNTQEVSITGEIFYIKVKVIRSCDKKL